MSSDRSNTVIDYGDFAARLAAQQDRWSLLREVLNEWGGAPQDEVDPAFADDAIAHAERQLGIKLPTALKEWYALPFRFHRASLGGSTRILPPDSLRFYAKDGFITFHTEDQDCCEWGFRIAETGMADPPVYNGMDLVFDRSDFSEVDLTWILQSMTLSNWVLSRTISDAICEDRSYASVAEVSPLDAAALVKGFRRMGFATQPWFQIDLFGGPNAIAFMGPANHQLGWDRIKGSGPYPTTMHGDIWDHYWEPATAGPKWLALYCRDETTLEQFVSSPSTKWELQERHAPSFLERILCGAV